MLEKYLVAHCSPTLAGLKSANIFNYSFTSIKLLKQQLEHCGRMLRPKGVSIRVLRASENKALIYVYRGHRVQEELKRQGVFDFLSNYGYETDRLDNCLRFLSMRISSHLEFPHEIGLFLGYPLGDVIGFVENKGKNSRCSGCWKVYCNECEAKKLFARFEKCRCLYHELFNRGKTICQLTVSA